MKVKWQHALIFRLNITFYDREDDIGRIRTPSCDSIPLLRIDGRFGRSLL